MWLVWLFRGAAKTVVGLFISEARARADAEKWKQHGQTEVTYRE